MRLSARALNRATLQRQLLLAREPLPVVAGVGRVFALQAQEPASPYLALWNRLVDFDVAELDLAFAERAIVKSTLMRVTLHAVTADDYPHVQAAMRPRLRDARLNDRRFRALEFTADEADAVFAELAEFLAEPRTNAEVDGVIRERLGELPPPGLWWALRTFTALHHAPTGAAWTFGPRPSYVAATAPLPDTAAGVRHYVQRHLEAFGPASVLDLAQFSLLLRPTLREAIAGLELRRYDGPDGELVDLPEAPVPDEDLDPPPRLLPMWDSVLFAHANRARVIPPEYRSMVIRRNGDTLATVLVDGYVAGVWRPVADGIEVTAFRRLPAATWRGLTDEAGRLRAFLADRDPEVYRRHVRWWTTLAGELPAGAQVRTV